MEFADGATVYTADGDNAGDIDRVVLDPGTGEAAYLVVRKGVLFTQDKLIPVDLVARSDEDQVVLKPDVKDFDDLPDFEQEHYIDVGESELQRAGYSPYYARPLYWYPVYGAYPVGFPDYPWPPTYGVEVDRNIPEGTVPLEEGAKVISADGENVGDVERILVDKDTEKVTHFLVSEGVLFKKHKLIPSNWIARVEEDEVHLKVGSQQLQRLPDYQD